MIGKPTAAQLRQLKRDNLAWPVTLAPVPRGMWPALSGVSDLARFGLLRSRSFLVQMFDEPDGIVRMSVNRTEWDERAGRWREDIGWDDLQRLKREAGYGDRCAVEVMPPDALVVNVANMRHVLIYPAGVTLPFVWGGADMSALLPLATWVPILDGDAVAAAIYDRHYSSERSRARRRERGTLLILGPGQKLLLATPCRHALFAWRVFIDDAQVEGDETIRQTGVCCAIFSNRGAGLSSDLIRAADAIADSRWPGERHYTYVDPRATASRRSRRSEPGQCFIHADWRFCGRTKRRGLHILERSPA